MISTLSKAKAMELWNDNALYLGEDMLPLDTLGELFSRKVRDALEYLAKEYPEYIFEHDLGSMETVKLATLEGFLRAVQLNNLFKLKDDMETPSLYCLRRVK